MSFEDFTDITSSIAHNLDFELDTARDHNDFSGFSMEFSKFCGDIEVALLRHNQKISV